MRDYSPYSGRAVFLSRSLSRALRKATQLGKGKTREKNVLRSKTTNRQTYFKLRFEAIVNVFVSRLVLA